MQTALSLTLGSYARCRPVREGWFLSCFSFLPYSTGEGNIMLDKKVQCAIKMVSKRVLFDTEVGVNSSHNPTTCHNMSCKNF
jgi:hypothetical protein